LTRGLQAKDVEVASACLASLEEKGDEKKTLHDEVEELPLNSLFSVAVDTSPRPEAQPSADLEGHECGAGNFFGDGNDDPCDHTGKRLSAERFEPGHSRTTRALSRVGRFSERRSS